ncbi:MAG: long-chain-fatty-acid--CoA ligase LcfB, partial [Pseudomonadota bacterium]
MPNHLFDQFKVSTGSAEPFLHLAGRPAVTYGEAFTLSGKIALALRSFGVGVGDRVAVQAEKCPEYLLTYLACVRAGAVFVPLNTAYTDAEISYFIGDAEPKLFVCDPMRQDSLAKLMNARNGAVATMAADGSGSLLARALELEGEFENEARCADDLAAILYTSG